jgi:hypothetical protein
MRRPNFCGRIMQWDILQRTCKLRKQRGHPATGQPLLQGRIVPTEANFRQNFLRKSYEPKNHASSDFCEINAFVFI